MENRVRPRKFRRNRMVVGNDSIDAETVAFGDFLHVRYSAIAGDNDLGAFAGQMLHGPFVQAISVRLAMRKEDIHLGSQGPESRPEDHRSAHSVGVVIAVNDDLLF